MRPHFSKTLPSLNCSHRPIDYLRTANFILATMVVYYSLFGQKVGSHVVRPTSLRAPQADCLKTSMLNISLAICVNIALTTIALARDGHSWNNIRWRLGNERRQQEAAGSARTTNQCIKQGRGELCNVSRPLDLKRWNPVRYADTRGTRSAPWKGAERDMDNC